MSNSENDSEMQLTSDEFDRLAVLAKSDSAAAAELISRVMPVIRAFSHTFDSTVSEDLLQEGLLGALGAISDYDPKKGRAATFIIACARNKMYSAHRRITYPREVASEEETFREEPADEPYIDALYEAIDRCLTDLERKVVGSVLMGLSYRETSKRLGITEKSVDNAMQRARRKLRAAFDETV